MRSDTDSTITSEEVPFLSSKHDQSSQQMIPLPPHSSKHDQVSNALLTAAVGLPKLKILQVYRNVNKTRAAIFRITKHAVADACEGKANVKYAWYGGSAKQIQSILTFGFGGESLGGDSFHGVGVYLSPVDHAADVGSCAPDEECKRYMLLLRVILGRVEQIPKGSLAFVPTSGEYHSGVDDLASPRRYVVWYCNMNTHIFPEFLVCFRMGEVAHMPSSPFVKLDVLLTLLRGTLEEEKMEIVLRHYNDFTEMKLPRREMINKLRMIVGDKQLTSIIMECNPTSTV